MSNSLSEALAPLAARMHRVVREHEVLRVAAQLPGSDPAEAARLAAVEVLKWAQRRAGSRLPPEAWDGLSFDFLSGGRNSSAVRLTSTSSDIWAIRADDPDKNVPERVWSTEVVLGHFPDRPAQFSTRLLVATPEVELAIEPHTPGFVRQVSDKCGLFAGSMRVSADPEIYEDGEDAFTLLEHLTDPGRVLPTFLLTVAESDSTSLVNAEHLARGMSGLAHIAVVHPEACWQLTEQVGKRLSVFGGAVRVYMPGFDESADPYAHRLVLGGQLATVDDVARITRWLRETAAHFSLRRTRLGSDVLSFGAIRSASLDLRQTALRETDGSLPDQLAAAQEQNKELSKQVGSLKSEQDYYINEYEKERERAETAEAQAQKAAWRIQVLMDQIQESGGDPDSGSTLPSTWAELTEWCDQDLAGRLVLTPIARRGIRKPAFADVETAARSLLWLATEGRTTFIEGGRALANITILDGVQNAPCGADAYEFDWNGRRFSADWHVKNGGNTRDPSRCLRIYYCFDAQTQQVVVSDMPAHRRTGAT